jgi:hypothetical protein
MRLSGAAQRRTIFTFVFVLLSVGIPNAARAAGPGGTPPTTSYTATGSSLTFTPSLYADATAFNSYRFFSTAGYGWLKLKASSSGSEVLTVTAPVEDLVMCIFNPDGTYPTITAAQYASSGCDDDTGGGGRPTLTFTAVAGNTYYIGICHYNSAVNATATTVTFSISGIVGTSTINFSNQNGSYAGNKRAVVPITVNIGTAGLVTFYFNGRQIPGCKNISATTTATCNWKPIITGPQNISAVLTPSDSGYTSSSASVNLVVGKRSVTR